MVQCINIGELTQIQTQATSQQHNYCDFITQIIIIRKQVKLILVVVVVSQVNEEISIFF